MPISPERRAEINRQNARKSTGPRTPEGKAATRCNALKHGLRAVTIDPFDAPGEPEGSYRKALEFWVDDLKPQNVLECAMVERAGLAMWKLDRCGRFEDAAATRRAARPPKQRPDDTASACEEARRLGALLMLALDTGPLLPEMEDPNTYDPFDDAPGHVQALGSFSEGVEWLLREWSQVLPDLLVDGGPPPLGPVHRLQNSRQKALRLLGIGKQTPPLEQPLREAAEAEIRRLEQRHAELSATLEERFQADLALFGASPVAQLLIRYEAAAERELHRAVDTLLKLRKNPELVNPPEPVEPPAAAAPAAAAATRWGRAHTRRTTPPAPNEPTASERLNPARPVGTGRKEPRAAQERRL